MNSLELMVSIPKQLTRRNEHPPLIRLWPLRNDTVHDIRDSRPRPYSNDLSLGQPDRADRQKLGKAFGLTLCLSSICRSTAANAAIRFAASTPARTGNGTLVGNWPESARTGWDGGTKNRTRQYLHSCEVVRAKRAVQTWALGLTARSDVVTLTEWGSKGSMVEKVRTRLGWREDRRASERRRGMVDRWRTMKL